MSASMEAKEERADGREARESYTMLTETSAIARNHRTLRREICISRGIIFILLITSMAFCVILYVQQVHEGKNNENINKEKANETRPEYHTGDGAASDVETPLMASLTIKRVPTSEKANLTWQEYNINLNDFNFSESLIIPREGRYRLGLQITYSAKTPEDRSSCDNVAHKIVVYSDSYKDPLTILAVYRTVHRTRFWLESVSSEVYYVFNKGDEIKVESDNATLIDISNNGSTKNRLTIQFVSTLKNS